jgi:hypothetical protein
MSQTADADSEKVHITYALNQNEVTDGTLKLIPRNSKGCCDRVFVDGDVAHFDDVTSHRDKTCVLSLTSVQAHW